MWSGNDEVFGDFLEDCDCCGNCFPLLLIYFNGKQFLCARCYAYEEYK